MDWIIFWTAVGAVAAVLLIVGGLFRYFRSIDDEKMTTFKETINEKIIRVENRGDAMVADLQNKLDKSEFERYVDKTDQELTGLRQDIKEGNQALTSKMDDMNKEISNKLESQFNRLIDLFINKKT